MPTIDALTSDRVRLGADLPASTRATSAPLHTA